MIVVGAGITGLTAAYDLERRGIKATVIEASARAGGLIHTERVNGFVIEAGADSLLAQKPAALDLCEELGLGPEIQGIRPPGGAFVLRGGTLYALPKPSRLGIPLTWGALASYDLLPLAARARMAVEPWIRARTDAQDESVASFFRRRFGAATVDLIAQPLLGGIHAGDIEQLSMRALFPRLIEIERRDGRVGRLEAASTASGPEPSTSGGAFRALRGGMSELVSALERALPSGTIQYSTPAQRLERVETGWRLTAAGRTFEAPAMIIAAPASVAATLLQSIDQEASRLCASVPYVSTASVAVAWPRSAIHHPLAGTGFVVARRHSAVRITACTWVSSKWEGRAPEGVALLRAFIGGAHDPGAVDLSDDDLLAVARRDLGSVLGITAAPVLARVYRWPAAGAQHIVGHLSRMEALGARLAQHPGLFVAGSGFRSIGIPDCVADARAAAKAAAEFRGTLFR